MASTTTVKTILRDIARDLWRDKRPLDVTATGGSTTTVAVSGQAYSSASANAYDGVYIYVATDAGGASAAPEGEISRVTQGGFTGSSGTWTVSPAFTAAVASGDTVYFLYGLDRTSIVNAVNRVGAELYMPAYTVLSMVTDGNMETTGVGNWAAVGTPTTRQKTTTSGRVLIGTQALQIITDDISEGATSDTVRVHEGENLLLSVPVMCDAGSAIVTLYDATNGAAIRSATVDEEDWAEVRFQDVVPDGCEEVTVRILSATAASTIYVGWAALTSMSRSVFPLPSLVTDTSWLEGVFYLPQAFASEANDSYLGFTEELQPWVTRDTLRDWRADVSQRLVVDKPPSAPLFVKYRRTGPAVSADSDVVYAPPEVIIEGTLAELKLSLMERARANTELYTVLQREALRHAYTYRQLIDSLGLAKPEIKSVGRRTRIVGYRR